MLSLEESSFQIVLVFLCVFRDIHLSLGSSLRATHSICIPDPHYGVDNLYLAAMRHSLSQLPLTSVRPSRLSATSRGAFISTGIGRLLLAMRRLLRDIL